MKIVGLRFDDAELMRTIRVSRSKDPQSRPPCLMDGIGARTLKVITRRYRHVDSRMDPIWVDCGYCGETDHARPRSWRNDCDDSLGYRRSAHRRVHRSHAWMVR